MNHTADLNFAVILPEVILVLAAIGIIILDMFLTYDRKHRLAYFALAGVAASAACTFLCRGHGVSITFNGSFVTDFYSIFFKAIFYTAVTLTILMSIDYLPLAGISYGEYYALLLFSTVGLMIMVSSANMLVIYLGIELAAISFAALIGFMQTNPRSNEAAIKYFILSLFASGIFLYGVSLLYGVTGKLQIYGIAAEIARGGSHLNPAMNPALTVSLLLMILGFGFKIAYVPFNMWVPDVYEGAPTSIAAYLSLGPKAAGLAIMLRLFLVAMTPLKIEWSSTLYFISVLTMTAGNVFALTQNSVKRLLGYSGIAHVGYLLAGAATSAGNPQAGISGIVFYIFCYVFFSLGAFAVLIYLYDQNKLLENIEDFNGLSRTAPLAAFIMTVFLLSLAGIPPTAGFVGKFLIFSAIIGSRMYVLAVISVLNSAIAVYYYMRIVAAMYVKEPEGKLSGIDSISTEAALMVMVAFSILLGLFPNPLITLALRTARSLL